MRRDCSHYYRKSTSGGGSIERCSLDAAPDAPRSCPEHCTWFEKRNLSTAGFVYGSLTPQGAGSGEGPDKPLDDSARAALEEVSDFMNEIGEEVVAEERERKREERAKQPWWKKLF